MPYCLRKVTCSCRFLIDKQHLTLAKNIGTFLLEFGALHIPICEILNRMTSVYVFLCHVH